MKISHKPFVLSKATPFISLTPAKHGPSFDNHQKTGTFKVPLHNEKQNLTI